MDGTSDEKTFRKATETLAALNGPELAEFVAMPMPAPSELPPESGFGARLTAARTHYRLNVEALSRLTKATDTHESRGISATALLRYEATEALPGARELRLLCESLGLTSDWLVFGRATGNGISTAEESVLAALRTLHQEHAYRRELGHDMALTIDAHERRERLRRIEQAKRRP